jgi:O-antigen/teichoic acid export membrane protein
MAIMGAAYNVAVERMRTEGPEAARAQLATISAMLVALLVPLCAGGWLLAEPIARILVDEAYSSMTAAILPAALIAGSLRVFQDQCVDAGFLVFERQHYPAIVSAIDAATAIAGCLSGLWLGGVAGAAWGCAVGAAVTSLAGVSLATHVYGFRIRSEELIATLAATAGMTALVMLLPQADNLGSLVFVAGMGALTYAAGMAALSPRTRRVLWGG